MFAQLCSCIKKEPHYFVDESIFGSLPDEIVLEIFSSLMNPQGYTSDNTMDYARQLFNLMRVNHRFYRIAHDKTLWPARLIFIKSLALNRREEKIFKIERSKFDRGPSDIHLWDGYLFYYSFFGQLIIFDVKNKEKVIDIPRLKDECGKLKNLKGGQFIISFSNGASHCFGDLKKRKFYGIDTVNQEVISKYKGCIVFANNNRVDLFDPDRRVVVKTHRFEGPIYKTCHHKNYLIYALKDGFENHVVLYDLQKAQEIARQTLAWEVTKIFPSHKKHVLLMLKRTIGAEIEYGLTRIEFGSEETHFIKSGRDPFQIVSVQNDFLLIEELPVENGLAHSVYNIESGAKIARTVGGVCRAHIYDHYLFYVIRDLEQPDQQAFVIYDLEKEEYVHEARFKGIALSFCIEDLDGDILVVRQIREKIHFCLAHYYHIPSGKLLLSRPFDICNFNAFMDQKIASLRSTKKMYQILVDDFQTTC